MLRERLLKQLLSSLSPLIDKSEATLRASLIVAQLVGIAVMKCVVRAETVVRATNDELVALVTPAIEQYLL